jgi:nitrate/nitrite-specific signal transduction histidine kinase
MSNVLVQLKETRGEDMQLDVSELGEVIIRLQDSVRTLLAVQPESASPSEINRQIVAVYDDIEKVQALQNALSENTLAGLQATALYQSRLASNVLTQSVIIGIVVVLIAIATAYITDRRLRTISTLTNTATAIAAGDFTRTAPVEGNDEIGVLAESFNTMTGQLRELVEELEQRVADRTRAIELSSDISRRLSTILDPGQLVNEVVDLLQFAFNYYHVHIYLFDEKKDHLVMVGGTGEAGKTMLAQGHRIGRGLGLVGRATESGTTVIVPDTLQDPTWLPNQLLPETRSEIAVPIIYGDQVLGALDVQQNMVNGLGPQDADVLTSVANQLAIALRNAREYVRSQQQAQRESKIREVVDKIQGTQTVENAMQVAIRELGRIIRADRTMARLNVEENASVNSARSISGRDGE